MIKVQIKIQAFVKPTSLLQTNIKEEEEGQREEEG